MSDDEKDLEIGQIAAGTAASPALCDLEMMVMQSESAILIEGFHLKDLVEDSEGSKTERKEYARLFDTVMRHAKILSHLRRKISDAMMADVGTQIHWHISLHKLEEQNKNQADTIKEYETLTEKRSLEIEALKAKVRELEMFLQKKVKKQAKQAGRTP